MMLQEPEIDAVDGWEDCFRLLLKPVLNSSVSVVDAPSFFLNCLIQEHAELVSEKVTTFRRLFEKIDGRFGDNFVDVPKNLPKLRRSNGQNGQFGR